MPQPPPQLITPTIMKHITDTFVRAPYPNDPHGEAVPRSSDPRIELDVAVFRVIRRYEDPWSARKLTWDRKVSDLHLKECKAYMRLIEQELLHVYLLRRDFGGPWFGRPNEAITIGDMVTYVRKRVSGVKGWKKQMGLVAVTKVRVTNLVPKWFAGHAPVPSPDKPAAKAKPPALCPICSAPHPCRYS